MLLLIAVGKALVVDDTIIVAVECRVTVAAGHAVATIGLVAGAVM